jgi:chorismate dehydratase
MQPENLFTGGAEEKPSGLKNLNLVRDLPFLPLIFGMENSGENPEYQILYSGLAESGRRLRDGAADIALIPSSEYAIKKETWHVVPGICVAGETHLPTAQLFFRSGMADIKRVAIDPQAGAEQILLKVLMREKFGLSPDYSDWRAERDNIFAFADAVLLSGDRALFQHQQHSSRMDLGEEWYDLTGLPFVSAFWAGRDTLMSPEDSLRLISSFAAGQDNIDKIVAGYSKSTGVDEQFCRDVIGNSIYYQFGDREKEGLMEFYNYAFFYGLVDFIPDLYFLKS